MKYSALSALLTISLASLFCVRAQDCEGLRYEFDFWKDYSNERMNQLQDNLAYLNHKLEEVIVLANEISISEKF